MTEKPEGFDNVFDGVDWSGYDEEMTVKGYINALEADNAKLEKVLRKLIRMYVVSDYSWNHEEDTERHYQRLMSREE
jgi:hypothetical protein